MADINMFMHGHTPIVEVDDLNTGTWVVTIRTPDDQVTLFFETERDVVEFKKAVEAI